MAKNWHLWLASAAALACSVASATEPPLKLMVVHRPPYLIVEPHGGFSGIVIAPVVLAMKKAGIDYEMVQIPALRQLDELKNGKDRACSVGWYKTPEREQFASFSAPISKDAPWVGVTRANFTVESHATVDSLLSDPQVSVLVKVGYVHGDFLDRKIASMQSRRVPTTGDMPQLMQMLALGRADITFMPLEEVQYYIQTGLVKATEVHVVHFSEMPAGYTRYLMCSKAVSPQLINDFNAALPKTTVIK